MKQTTLIKPVLLAGRGLHTGKPSKIKLIPGGSSTGITIQRMVADLAPPVRIALSQVMDTSSAIHLLIGGRAVKSVEHLLGALYGMGVDNVNVQIWGEEIPALDGSAWPFVQAIMKVGVRPLDKNVEWISLKGPVCVGLDRRYLVGFPAKNFEVCAVVDYEHPDIGRQMFQGVITPRLFQLELAKAKTFGWTERISALRTMGLIQGGSPANALIYGERGLENPKMRTFEDEPVRHKAMDLLGALALLNGRLAAHLVAVRPGHVLDVEFAKAVEARGVRMNEIKEPGMAKPEENSLKPSARGGHQKTNLIPAGANVRI